MLLFPLRVPRTVLAIATFFTALFGAYAPFVHVDGAVDTLLVDGDPERAFHDEMERLFGSDELTRVGLFSEDVFTPTMLTRIERLTRDLRRIDGVRRVVSLTTITGSEMSEDGLRIGRLLRTMPRDQAEADAFRKRVLAMPLYLGGVVSPDSRATAVTVLFEPMTDEEFSGRGIEGLVRSAVGSLFPKGSFAISGIPTLKVHGSRQMETDIRIFSGVAVLLVTAILWAMFRTPRGVLLPLLTVGLGVVWTDGLMSLVGQPITIGSLVLNPLLMAIGVAYAIHMMSRYFQEIDGGGRPVDVLERTLDHVGLPVALAAVTTVFGFATLIPHPVPTIRDLGLYASFGIVVIYVASMTVVPAILVLLPLPRRRHAGTAPKPFVDALEALGRITSRHPRAVMLLTVALSLASVAGIARLHIETDYLGFFHPDSEVRRDSDRIGRHLAGTHPLYVIVAGDEAGAITAPDALRAIRDLDDFIRRQPRVYRTVSVLDSLSLARRALAPDAPGTLPETREEAEQLLLHVNPAEVRHVIDVDTRRTNLVAYTSLSASAEVAHFVESVEGHARDRLPAGLRARVTGTVVLLNHSADTLARQQVFGLVNMLVVLLVVLVALFRSLRMALLALVPNVVPIVFLFGIMGGSGVALDVSTSMIAAIALGIVVDDTIHYLTEFAATLREGASPEEAVHRTTRTVGQPIVFTAIVLAVGFLVSCLSGFQPVRHFGALSAATMIIGLFADLLLTPAIAMKMRIAPARSEGAAIALPERELRRTGGSYV